MGMMIVRHKVRDYGPSYGVDPGEGLEHPSDDQAKQDERAQAEHF
jgi:hypothetical protein